MLKILNRGIQVGIALKQTGLTGDLAQDQLLPYVQGLKGGRLAAVAADGTIALADGLAANNLRPVGFIINDAAGYFFENKPAFASGEVPISAGAQVSITDQIDATETFAPGNELYAGTGAKVGLITKTPATGAKSIGVALSAASAASPELKVLWS